MTAEDLKVDKSLLGLKGSPTKVKKSFTRGPKGAGEKVDMPPVEAASFIVNKLREKHLI
jgi:electron transfer flavoprotein beta subunit